MATESTPGRGKESRKSASAEVTPSGEVHGDLAGTSATVAQAVRRAAGDGPVPARAPSTNLTAELNNIDFRTMIGGPLQAAVDAQVASSLATVDFINKVGFTTPVDAAGAPVPGARREVVMVDFSHVRHDVDDSGAVVDRNVVLKVPLLAMLPIPSLRIDHVIIDFNVKLNSVETAGTSDELGVKADAKGGWGPVSFKVSASYQRKTTSNVEVKKEYALNVNVKAVQDELPAGLEKILAMLAT